MTIQKTALHDLHIESGAKLVDFAGWEMPIQYKNLKEEVLAVRNEVGMFDVSHMGEFIIDGKDTYKFLDYLLPNAIEKAQMNKAIYSPLLRENGTIIDDLIVYKISDTKALICVNAANIFKDFSWITSQIEKFDCQLSDISNEISLIALQGPKTEEIMKKLDLGYAYKSISYYSVTVDPSQTKHMIARTGYTGEDGFEIFGTHDYIKNIWTQLLNLGVKPCGLGARDVLRLEVCYPLYGNELNDNVTPLETGLKWTVKMDKDFIGKKALEINNVKTQIIKIILEKGIPRTGYALENHNGERIGEITSGSMSVGLGKGIALARVDKTLYQNTNEVLVDIRGKKYNAEIVKKPFVTGGHK